MSFLEGQNTQTIPFLATDKFTRMFKHILTEMMEEALFTPVSKLLFWWFPMHLLFIDVCRLP